MPQPWPLRAAILTYTEEKHMTLTIQRPTTQAGQAVREEDFPCQGYLFGGQPQYVTRPRAHIRAVSCPERCSGCQSRAKCKPPQDKTGVH